MSSNVSDSGKPGASSRQQTGVHLHQASVVTSAHGQPPGASGDNLRLVTVSHSPVKVPPASTAFRPVVVPESSGGLHVSSLARVSHVPPFSHVSHPVSNYSHVSHVGLPSLPLPTLPPVPSLLSYPPRPGILPISHAPPVPSILNPFR